MHNRLGLLLLVLTLLCGAPSVSAQELPEGKGKELVAAHCNSCHPFQARVGAGYTPKGWATVLRMMSNFGASLPAWSSPAPLRSHSRSGRYLRRDRGRMTRSPRGMDHFGIRARWPTCSVDLIRVLVGLRSTHSRRLIRGLTVSSRTRT